MSVQKTPDEAEIIRPLFPFAAIERVEPEWRKDEIEGEAVVGSDAI